MKKITQILEANTYAQKHNPQKLMALRPSSSQNHLFQTGFKTPEKSSRSSIQKTPLSRTGSKLQHMENKENQNLNISRGSSQKKNTKQNKGTKPTYNLMNQISAKLTSKSSSVPNILLEKKEELENKQFNLTEYQRLFAKNRVIRIQDLFTSKQNQITIQELEKSCYNQTTQESELYQSIQRQESNYGKEQSLKESSIKLEELNKDQQIYIIDLALL